MRILRIVTRPNVGGPMRQALALWHAHQATGDRTLLVTGWCEADEAAFDLGASGVPLLTPAEVEAHGVDAVGLCVVDTLRRALNPLRDLAAQRALQRLMRAFRPDVVHTHTSKAGVLGRRAAWHEHVPCVAHTFHGHVLLDYSGRLLSYAARLVERRLAEHSDRLFCVSQSCREELAALGVAAGAEVVQPAVPTTAFVQIDRARARQALGVEPGVPLLGFVGRMVPIKRPELFAALCRALPGVRGIALGDGPLQEELRGGGSLHVMPSDPHPERIVGALDALILPSRREGFPIAGIEAAAAGVPTFGFAVPGLVDLDRALGGGFVVDEARGLDGLIARLRQHLDAGCPRIGPLGPALAAACDPRVVAVRLREAYRATLASKGRSVP